MKYQQLREHMDDLIQEKDTDDIEVLYALYELERDERIILIGNRNRPTIKVSSSHKF